MVVYIAVDFVIDLRSIDSSLLGNLQAINCEANLCSEDNQMKLISTEAFVQRDLLSLSIECNRILPALQIFKNLR